MKHESVLIWCRENSSCRIENKRLQRQHYRWTPWRLGISINQSTFNCLWNRRKSQGTFHPEDETRGRHSLYSEHEKKLFTLHILKNRSITPKDLDHASVINTRQTLARTIQRYLNNIGLQYNIHPQHPLVNETHRKLRLKWAQAWRRWVIERFHRICFLMRVNFALKREDAAVSE